MVLFNKIELWRLKICQTTFGNGRIKAILWLLFHKKIKMNAASYFKGQRRLWSYQWINIIIYLLSEKTFKPRVNYVHLCLKQVPWESSSSLSRIRGIILLKGTVRVISSVVARSTTVLFLNQRFKGTPVNRAQSL